MRKSEKKETSPQLGGSADERQVTQAAVNISLYVFCTVIAGLGQPSPDHAGKLRSCSSSAREDELNAKDYSGTLKIRP